MKQAATGLSLMSLVVSEDLSSGTHVSPFSCPFLGGAEGGGQLDVRSLGGEGVSTVTLLEASGMAARSLQLSSWEGPSGKQRKADMQLGSLPWKMAPRIPEASGPEGGHRVFWKEQREESRVGESGDDQEVCRVGWASQRNEGPQQPLQTHGHKTQGSGSYPAGLRRLCLEISPLVLLTPRKPHFVSQYM